MVFPLIQSFGIFSTGQLFNLVSDIVGETNFAQAGYLAMTRQNLTPVAQVQLMNAWPTTGKTGLFLFRCEVFFCLDGISFRPRVKSVIGLKYLMTNAPT